MSQVSLDESPWKETWNHFELTREQAQQGKYT
uniref:Uncharacterized protein n=1 Tax=Rhizophora mucronata TaxID=61149 RepID=A0A2P2QXC6_RHIMU